MIKLQIVRFLIFLFLMPMLFASEGVELIYNANNENGIFRSSIDKDNKQEWKGSFYMRRNYKDKLYLLTGNEKHPYIYQAFETIEGETYRVKATLIGADTSSDENFDGASIIAISNTLPKFYGVNEMLQSKSITGDTPIEEVFTFVAKSPLTYVILRGDTAWRNPHLYSLSVKNVSDSSVSRDDVSQKKKEVVQKKIDTISPIITLHGKSKIRLSLGDTYSDAGATAVDMVDGNITKNIHITNLVDTATAGRYIVTYNVKDEAGNKAKEVSRNIVVEDVVNETLIREELVQHIKNWAKNPSQKNEHILTTANTSKITDMSDLFYLYGYEYNDLSFSEKQTLQKFNLDISNWDTSSVKKMNQMFFYADSFNQPIGKWDISSVTEMNAMFSFATAFNHPIEKWNTSSVVNMSEMFTNAISFNQPIGKWDTSSVINFSFMFYHAEAFNKPLNNWDISKVSSYINFSEGSALDIKNLPNFYQN
ncbi:MAG: BspA family leucine-rich repeat surface protein [Sulfurovum sp.]|nr:BspA family leucine-rich repeat surface protein [Sulfurovum sp.]